MDRRTFLKTSLAATTALAATGALPEIARAQASKPATLAFFIKNVTNPFWKACRIGAEKAGKELGVTVETVAPTKPDNIEEQTRLVEDWIVKKPDAFVFVPVDYKALVPAIDKMVKSDKWKKILAERGWLDLYQPRAEFTEYLAKDNVEVTATLSALGMVK